MIDVDEDLQVIREAVDGVRRAAAVVCVLVLLGLVLLGLVAWKLWP